MTTVYKELKDSGISFTQKDSLAIGRRVFQAYKQWNTEPLERVSQIEDFGEFMVYEYPDKMRPAIQKIVLRFFREQYKKKGFGN